MTDVEIITDAGRAREIAPEWDVLAVAAAQPTSAPAWMLGWWRHVAPAGAALRIAAVREGERLTGLVPFYRAPGRRGPAGPLRLLADAPSAPSAPLAEAGREWEVAAAAIPALADHEGRSLPMALAHVAAASPWARACRESAPGRLRPLTLTYGLQVVPTVSFAGTYEEWMATRSTRFRRKLRQLERKYARAGGTSRLATAGTLTADVDTFLALHRARWAGRGTSPLVELGDRFRALLLAVGRELVADERLRLWILEIDGEPICADLSFAAGGEVDGYNTGWDARFAAYNPTRLSFLRKIEDGFARGDRRLSLGSGMIDYKQSFANATDTVAWDLVLPAVLAGARRPRPDGRRGRARLVRAAPAPRAQRRAVRARAHAGPPRSGDGARAGARGTARARAGGRPRRAARRAAGGPRRTPPRRGAGRARAPRLVDAATWPRAS